MSSSDSDSHITSSDSSRGSNYSPSPSYSETDSSEPEVNYIKKESKKVESRKDQS